MFLMITRRTILLGLLCSAFVTAGQTQVASAQERQGVTSRTNSGVDGLNPGLVERPDLKELLETGLKARRPQEFAFINRVIIEINRGRLPVNMVRATFLWARKNHSQRPFQPFEFAITTRAREELGVIIPTIETGE